MSSPHSKRWTKLKTGVRQLTSLMIDDGHVPSVNIHHILVTYWRDGETVSSKRVFISCNDCFHGTSAYSIDVGYDKYGNVICYQINKKIPYEKHCDHVVRDIIKKGLD
jgi:hypothetical protein